jgi:hypothetical protein
MRDERVLTAEDQMAFDLGEAQEHADELALEAAEEQEHNAELAAEAAEHAEDLALEEAVKNGEVQLELELE